jgi:acyl carrier protein
LLKALDEKRLKRKRFTISSSREPRHMSSSQTYTTLHTLLLNKFHGNVAVTPDTALTELGLDSLTLMEFIFAVEDAFNIRIPEERIDPRQGHITLEQVCSIIDEIRTTSKI